MTPRGLDVDRLLSESEWLQRLARRLLGAGPDAEDLAQETWLRALQGRQFEDIRGVYLYHAVTALRRTGQEYLARMIAAEALART